MDSISDAMKAALEHPMEEPPHRPRLTRTPKAQKQAAQEAGNIWWGLAGFVGSLSLAAMLLMRNKRRNAEWRARHDAALAAMDFGGD